jgi:hypothetical protein
MASLLVLAVCLGLGWAIVRLRAAVGSRAREGGREDRGREGESGSKPLGERLDRVERGQADHGERLSRVEELQAEHERTIGPLRRLARTLGEPSSDAEGTWIEDRGTIPRSRRGGPGSGPISGSVRGPRDSEVE